MEKTIKQKLIVPLLICIAFIAVGVNSIAQGITKHQNLRIILAAAGIAIFAAGVTLILYKIRQENKAAKA